MQRLSYGLKTKTIEVITLAEAMKLVSENQTEMTRVLGINRGTLRKYLVNQGGKKLLKVVRAEDGAIDNLELINNMHGVS